MTLATLNLTQTNPSIVDLIHHPEFLWENGSEIHLQIIFRLRTLPDPKANLIQMVTDSWTCYQRILEDKVVSILGMNELGTHGSKWSF